MIVRLIGRGRAFPVEPQSDEFEDTPSQGEKEHDEQFNETEPAAHGLSIVIRGQTLCLTGALDQTVHGAQGAQTDQ